MNLEHEQKNFSDFNDYFNSLFENKYYELSYEIDKKAIENNLVKVSKEENKRKIEHWLSNQSIFEFYFIIYFYKKNKICFEEIKVENFFKDGDYLLAVNGKLTNEKQLLKILNNTFYIDNEIVYNYDFLKEKKIIDFFDIEFDIKEFSKLFVIKDKIKDF